MAPPWTLSLGMQIHSIAQDFDDVYVVANQADGKTTSWTVTLDSAAEGLLHSIQQLSGLQSVELEPEATPVNEKSHTSRQASAKSYIANPKNRNDTAEMKKTYDFTKQTVVNAQYLDEIAPDGRVLC